MAGFIVDDSSSPSRPPSPAWGLSERTAMRGATTPKSRFNESLSCIIRRTIDSLSIAAATSDTGICIVTSPTRSTSLHIIIIASPPDTAARNSVWPV